MGKALLKPTWYMTDAAFDWLYPERIQLLSKRHWTPMGVAKKAAQFLANRTGKEGPGHRQRRWEVCPHRRALLSGYFFLRGGAKKRVAPLCTGS